MSSGEKPEDWSLLLAAASDRATIRRIPKGSRQASRITATIVVYSVPSSTARNVAPCPSHANAHSVLRGQRGLFSTDSGVNGALWRSSSPLAIVTGHSEERSDSCCRKIAAFDGFPHHGFLDKPRKPVFRLIVIKSYRLEAEVRFLKLLSARLVFM